jgi:predicted permease
MTIETMREFLGWCVVINLAVLAWWFLWLWLAHDYVYRMHSRWFAMPVERFNTIHYAGMAMFKLLVLVLNVVPYAALWIVG